MGALASKRDRHHLFLDPAKPLSTCSAADCAGCPVQRSLHCHFAGRDLARFMAVSVPPFVVGGTGIVLFNAWLLVPWAALFIGYFGFVEIRVMCSHCPHYAEPGRSLQCWANYGSPKLWRSRPGPMSAAETAVFFVGLGVLAGYPLVVLALGGEWLLIGLLALAVAVMAGFMAPNMCNQCMNSACPLNRVDPAVRADFLARNPTVAAAWGPRVRA